MVDLRAYVIKFHDYTREVLINPAEIDRDHLVYFNKKINSFLARLDGYTT